MSRVFLGRDEVLARPVAIKILNPDYGETDIGIRFRREGRTAARLAHPNIVQVYDAGAGRFEGREISFIVMEHVRGGDLKGLIDERGVLSGAELARLSGAAAGLAHAHERGVIHRDIKPHNILITDSGEMKVTDFGVARALDATHATRTGAYLGTALYSSPEQLRGDKVSPKSDVYSLGVTLYHAATGQTPFAGTPIEVASQHVSREPTSPRRLNDAMSASLEALILDCLKKDPGSRPTADEVRLGLMEAGRGVYATPAYPAPPALEPGERAPAAPQAASAQTLPGTTVYPGRRKRRRGVLAVLALAALLALGGAIVAPALVGSGGRSANAPGQGGQNPAGTSGPGQAEGGQGQQQEARAARPAGQQASQQPSQVQSEQSQVSGLTRDAAAQTVKEFYAAATAGNFDRSAQLLSESFRQSTFPNRGVFEGTFAGVESVEFIEGPTAKVSGDTATVTGRTRATKTGQVELNEGTWYLVNEGGEWKINAMNVRNITTQAA